MRHHFPLQVGVPTTRWPPQEAKKARLRLRLRGRRNFPAPEKLVDLSSVTSLDGRMEFLEFFHTLTIVPDLVQKTQDFPAQSDERRERLDEIPQASPQAVEDQGEGAEDRE